MEQGRVRPNKELAVGNDGGGFAQWEILKVDLADVRLTENRGHWRDLAPRAEQHDFPACILQAKQDWLPLVRRVIAVADASAKLDGYLGAIAIEVALGVGDLLIGQLKDGAAIGDSDSKSLGKGIGGMDLGLALNDVLKGD